jgi:predicted nucleotide-binding protein
MTKARAKRPVVFVGSSTEGLPVAKAIQVALDHACEVRLWTQGVFGLSQGTLEALVSGAQQFDFAVLVLTPDDLVESRGVGTAAARDNVLFELGLFMGVLGRRRTFIVYDRSVDLRLPSDLAGVTCATYEPHSDPAAGLRGPMGASCTLIEEAMQAEGPRVKPADIAALEDTVRKLQGQLRGRLPAVNPVRVEGGALPGHPGSSGERILVDSFLIDAFPVTNREFERFVAENNDWSQEAIDLKKKILEKCDIS